jgi:P4 family phage/plasmid primase-like protien
MTTISDTERFLQALFRSRTANAVFSNWVEGPRTRVWTTLNGTLDCYYSIGEYLLSATSNTREHSLGVRVLVIDDVVELIPAALVLLALGTPTAIVQSSAGSQQWVYRLSELVSVWAWPRVLKAVDVLIGHSTNARTSIQLCRLPMGRNTKPKPGRNGFEVHLVELHPEVEIDTAWLLVLSPGATSVESTFHPDQLTYEEAAELMDMVPNKDVDRSEYIEVGYRLQARCPEGEPIWQEWAAKSSKDGTKGTGDKWGGINATATNGWLLDEAARKAEPERYAIWHAKWQKRRGLDAETVFDDGELERNPPPLDDHGGGGYSITHADMAAEIVRAQRGTLGWLSNSRGGRWAGFDEIMGRWVVEEHDKLLRAAVRAEVLAQRLAADDKTARKLAEAKWQGAVQALLTRHERLLIPFERFDADLNMFGIPGGVVRLTNSCATEERGAASQMVSKAMAVRPAPRGAKGVAWERFLDDFTMGNAGLRVWWQAFCGYCLTGHTYEHMVVFLYGPGGNGKSVFLDTLAEVMGPYHERAASAVFMAQQGGKHMAMVADLAGARLVTSPDVPLGAAWDLGMLKPLTGGGTYKAQFMKENWFRFTPQFKLILAGNEKPILGTVDAAVRRRFWLVPAMHVPKTINKQLVDVLRGEQAAILRWMIDGWELYSTGGLPPCKMIERATEDYLNEQDTFARWAAETITKAPGDMTRHRINDLWLSWDAFRAAEGVWKAAPVRREALSTKLKEAGFEVTRDKQGAYVDQISVTKTTIF